jgi:hypothetical protein
MKSEKEIRKRIDFYKYAIDDLRNNHPEETIGVASYLGFKHILEWVLDVEVPRPPLSSKAKAKAKAKKK